MKRKMLAGVLLGMSLLVSASNVVTATETETYFEGDEEEIEYTEEEFLSDEGNVPEGEGDEETVITSTSKSEENNSQVTIKGSIPDKFGLDLYCDFRNEETGVVYRLFALYKNDYTAFLFVPNGNYKVIQCGVWGDTTNKYPLNYQDSFTLAREDFFTIEPSLIHEDEIKEEIERRENDIDEQEEEYTEETELEVKEIVKKEPYHWRKIKKSAGIEADVTVNGISKSDYDIIIKFVKTGEVNDAEFIYSMDGGETWSTNELLKGSFMPNKCGITFEFPTDDVTGQSSTWTAIYKEGETIEFSVKKEFDINAETSKGGIINAYLNDKCYTDAKVVVKITKSGKKGEATFDYSLDEGATFTGENIPMNQDYLMTEIPVVLQFTDLAGAYVVNDTFSFEVKGEPVEKDTTYLLYILAGIVGALAAGGYMWLLTLRDKDSDYVLNEYEPYSMKTNEKRRKK